MFSSLLPPSFPELKLLFSTRRSIPANLKFFKKNRVVILYIFSPYPPTNATFSSAPLYRLPNPVTSTPCGHESKNKESSASS